MKYFLVLTTILIIASCNCTKKNQPSKQTITENNKNKINNIVLDTVDNQMMLLGKINKEGFSNKSFSGWYIENFDNHILDTNSILSIKPLLSDIKIKAFLGTWCSDSQREIPALYKILDAANFNYNQLETIAVSHKKETPNHLEKNMDIQYVPTIIFYKNGKEIGRFVELPQETLEKDILTILNQTGYKHSYEE